MSDFANSGLSSKEVSERIAAGLTNKQDTSSSRKLTSILRANFFTLFNAIVGGSFLALLLLGQWKDALFGLAVISNILIGVIQEYRSKRTLDRISLLYAPHARARRDGRVVDLKLEEIVMDDLLELKAGDQLLADAEVVFSDGLELDESILTGESEPVEKSVGNTVLASSAVSAGRGFAKVTQVGSNTYASKITLEAKKFSLVSSELRNAINQVIKWISWALLPFVLIAANGQMQARGGWVTAIADGSWLEATVAAIASVIAFVPQGLVLITSITFAVAAMKLANKKVLLQELPAVEGLARVDVVCFDKTGTLTEGDIEFEALELVGPKNLNHEAILAYFGNDPDANATTRCLQGHFTGNESLKHTASVEFTSAKKLSSFTFKDSGTWTFGAPEFVLDKKHRDVLTRAAELAATGRRTLVLTNNEQPIAVVTFRERIRPDAASTVAYFREQGVLIRIISGDNPQTVAAVARDAGVEFEGVAFDAQNLPEDIEALAEIMEQYTVFGRVTPEQKRNMVAALQLKGHVVAMTGDGVNDALALKKADIGIAMGSGSPATKAVSNLVLLDGKFSNLPGVVAEGRKVIANIERVSKLFLTKTSWALTLALVFGVMAWKFPFLPRQLSGIDSFTIGLPAFALALLPNARRYVPGFLGRALSFTIPSGIAVALAVISLRLITDAEGWSVGEAQTATMITMSVTGIWVLSTLARPIDKIKLAIFFGMIVLGVLIFTVPLSTGYFGFGSLSLNQLLLAFGIGLAGSVLIEIAHRVSSKRTSALG
jgi:cation-transporting ATPase E